MPNFSRFHLLLSPEQRRCDKITRHVNDLKSYALRSLHRGTLAANRTKHETRRNLNTKLSIHDRANEFSGAMHALIRLSLVFNSCPLWPVRERIVSSESAQTDSCAPRVCAGCSYGSWQQRRRRRRFCHIIYNAINIKRVLTYQRDSEKEIHKMWRSTKFQTPTATQNKTVESSIRHPNLFLCRLLSLSLALRRTRFKCEINFYLR